MNLMDLYDTFYGSSAHVRSIEEHWEGLLPVEPVLGLLFPLSH